ncbi:polyhydroxyalkanoate synthesis repressor PhaR [Salinisphaera sp. SPP-AMP-43]|uniref:polyhydroxyalkanoate synthesis repressor PhaR n=1 Tax=Salinisphaera sp. SPP-AMP-43 TaxID=3121288 RepID=UPI003C6E32F7
MASTQRIIKKYPNRRLYDTEVSRYITLDHVRQLVIANEDFTIVDKRSGRDITRSILLQVISEQEEGGDPIFRTEILRHIIRFYGDSMQGAMSSYLELSLELFNEQQAQFRERLRRLLGANNPLAALRELSQHQLPIWRSVRREFLANLDRRDTRPPEDDAESDISSDTTGAGQSNTPQTGDASNQD